MDGSVDIDLLLLTTCVSLLPTSKVCRPSLRLSPPCRLFPLGIKSHYRRRAISAPHSWRQIHGRPHGTLLVIIKSRLGRQVPADLQLLCLWTDCGWFDANSR